MHMQWQLQLGRVFAAFRCLLGRRGRLMGNDVRTVHSCIAARAALVGRGRSGPRSCYLTRMSFFTDFTPFTPRAISPAFVMSPGWATKPDSCTVPLNVSTLISVDFRVGSLKI